MVKIAPSILAADLLDIKNEVINVDDAGAEFIHIDVMDAVSYTHLTLPTKRIV